MMDIIINSIPKILDKIIDESREHCSPKLSPIKNININDFYLKHKKKSLEVFFYIAINLINIKNEEEIREFTDKLSNKIVDIAECGYGEEELTPEFMNELISYINEILAPLPPAVEGKVEINSKQSNEDELDNEKDEEIKIYQTQQTQFQEEINSKTQSLINQYEEQIKAVETECKDQIEAAETKCKEQIKTIEKKYKEQIEAAEIKCKKQIKEMEADCLIKINEEKNNCKNKIQILERSYHNFEKEIEDKSKELNNTLEEKCHEFKEQENQYIKLLETKDTEIKKMKKNLNNIKKKKGELETNYEVQIKELNDRMEEMKSKYEYIKEENAKLKKDKLKNSKEIPNIHPINETYKESDKLESLENKLNILLNLRQD